MSFVYEMVGEENKELWKSLGWKNWGEKPLLFYKRDYWSRDKQRNIFLVGIGGYIDMPEYYDMCYKGRMIRMEVAGKTEGDRNVGVTFLWDIYKKDHKMDYNPNRACFKPIFNTFKQDLPIKFEDIPSVEKTCDRIWGRQRVSCTCKSCGTFFEKTYISLKNHEMLELCKSCLQKHVAQNRSQEVKDLRSKKLSEKLKAVRQTKNDEIVAKRNATIIERYGSKENLVKIVTEKARATNYEKYGIASLTAAMNLKKEKQNCEKTC